MNIRFGPAGAAASFYAEKHKSSLEMPEWLAKRGLNAYEYQCGRGVRISEETAGRLGELAAAHDIRMSIHAPYYINLSSVDPEIQIKSQGHLLKTLHVARAMGAGTVVFHPGSAAGDDRKECLARAKRLLKEILVKVKEEGLGGIILAPETMGKKNQLGTLEEVLEMCEISEQLRPAVDFGHIHAVTGGSLVSRDAFAALLETIEKRLGLYYLQHLHIHFSPVEFTAAGEKKHGTTLDAHCGPEFAPLAALLLERNLTPTVICESSQRQAEDAMLYRDIYLTLAGAGSVKETGRVRQGAL